MKEHLRMPRRGFVLASILLFGLGLGIWSLHLARQVPKPEERSLGNMFHSITTMTAADDLVVLESPLVRTVDLDRPLLALRGGKPVHFGRAGFDLLAPRMIDHKTVLVAVRKRAFPRDGRPDKANEYSIETCDLESHRCAELVSAPEFREVARDRTIQHIVLFPRKGELIIVLGSAIDAIADYTIHRKVEGQKMELIKRIDGQFIGMTEIFMRKDNVIFYGRIYQPKYDRKIIVCENDNCLFGYDINRNIYLNSYESTGFENIPVDSDKRKFPEIMIGNSIKIFMNNKFYYLKHDSLQRNVKFYECNAKNECHIMLTHIDDNRRGYYGSIIPFLNSFLYTSMRDKDRSSTITKFDHSGNEEIFFRSSDVKNIETIEIKPAGK